MHSARLCIFILLCAGLATCKPAPKPVAQPSADAGPQAPGLPGGAMTGPAGAPPPAATAPAAAKASSATMDTDALRCDQQIGKAAAKHLADRCLMVSPASHPPCNVANACQMIRDEIKRSCDLFDPNQPKPKECTG